MKIEQKLGKYLHYIIEPLLLLIAFIASLTVAPLFRPAFKNPFNISNPNNVLGISSDGNFYVLITIILGTLVLFYVLRWLYHSRFAWLIKLIVVLILLANFFLLNSLNSPGYMVEQQVFDNFHNGEQLAPANAWLNDNGLYKDMFYLRGAGVDAVLPAFALKLFGESIGAFLLFTDLSMLIAILSFLILLSFLIRNPLLFAGASVLFYTSNAISLIHVRDVLVWVIFGLILFLFKTGLTVLQQRVTLFSIGMLSALMLYVSVDRGMLLLITVFLLGIVLIFTRNDKKNIYFLSFKNWKHQIRTVFWLFSGLFAGIFIPAFMLGPEGFKNFIRMTFIEIPSYGGLLVGMPFPTFNSVEHMIWGPVFIAIATGYLLLKLYESKVNDLNHLLPYTLLFIFGVLCIKLGANRIHVTKMASVISPLYLISVIILVYSIALAYKQKRFRAALVPAIIVSTGLLLVYAQFNFAQLLKQPTYNKWQLSNYKNLPNTKDENWISAETKAVKDYVVKNTGTKDRIFSFTSDPIYYYLTNRQNSTRFYVSWFADPQPYTDQLLTELKNNQPAIIIYKENTWMDAPDNIPMETRLPEVNKWINENYHSKIQIGETTLLKP